MLPTEEGREPVRILWLRERTDRLVMFPIEKGREPVRRLEFRSR
jgi:hypothetical protein